MKVIKKGADFAKDAHGSQMYGDKPYKYHLEKVTDNATKFGGSKEEILAAWLHDVVEDTSVTKQQVAEKFGDEVAEIVYLVSNTGNKEETFRRIRTNPKAVFVKLSDRLANVSEGEKNSKYRKEHKLFKEILYREGEYEELWTAIEDALKN